MPEKEMKKRPNYGVLDVRYSFSRTTPLFWIFVIAFLLILVGLIFKFARFASLPGFFIIFIYILFGIIVLIAMKYSILKWLGLN